MMKKLNRDELIALVQKTLHITGLDGDMDAWLTEFERVVPHLTAPDLIYWNPSQPRIATAGNGIQVTAGKQSRPSRSFAAINHQSINTWRK